MLRAVTRVAVLLCVDVLVALIATRILREALGVSGTAAIAVILVSLAAFGTYRAGAPRRSLIRVTGAVAVSPVVLLALALAQHGHVRWQPLGGFALLVAAGVTSSRAAVELAIRAAYERGLLLRRALLVGTRQDARAAGRLMLDGSRDQRIVGVVSPGPLAERDALGTMRQLSHLLREHDVEEVVVVSRLSDAVLDEATEDAFSAGARCFAVPWALNPQHARSEPVRLGSCPAFRLHPAELELPEFLLKRALDLLVTSVLLVVAIPVGAIAAAAIRLETPGPIFFASRRVGLGGREFVMYKFRSMRTTAERDVAALAEQNEYGDSPFFKLRRDPRVTRVGRLLRRTSLDELPQLLNVLRGDMSLVGPRPPLPREVARYAPHHRVRLCVLPGMTGPWQVGGRNLITDFEEIVRMEREYIESWSLATDLDILVRTVGAVVTGRGAY